MDDNYGEMKSILDGAAASVAVVGGLMVDNLNEMLLVATLVWTIVRIWETSTIQRLFRRKKEENG